MAASIETARCQRGRSGRQQALAVRNNADDLRGRNGFGDRLLRRTQPGGEGVTMAPRPLGGSVAHKIQASIRQDQEIPWRLAIETALGTQALTMDSKHVCTCQNWLVHNVMRCSLYYFRREINCNLPHLRERFPLLSRLLTGRSPPTPQTKPLRGGGEATRMRALPCNRIHLSQAHEQQTVQG